MEEQQSDISRTDSISEASVKEAGVQVFTLMHVKLYIGTYMTVPELGSYIQIFIIISTVGVMQRKYLKRSTLVMRLQHQTGCRKLVSASCSAEDSCARANSLSSSSPLSEAQNIITQVFPIPEALGIKTIMCTCEVLDISVMIYSHSL